MTSGKCRTSQCSFHMESPMMPRVSHSNIEQVSLSTTGRDSQTLIIQRKKYRVGVIVALFWRTIFFAPGTPQQSSLRDRIGRNCQNNMGPRTVIVAYMRCLVAHFHINTRLSALHKVRQTNRQKTILDKSF